MSVRRTSRNFAKKALVATSISIAAIRAQMKILPLVRIVEKPKYQKKIALRKDLTAVSDILVASCSIIVATDVKVKIRPISFGHY